MEDHFLLGALITSKFRQVESGWMIWSKYHYLIIPGSGPKMVPVLFGGSISNWRQPWVNCRPKRGILSCNRVCFQFPHNLISSIIKSWVRDGKNIVYKLERASNFLKPALNLFIYILTHWGRWYNFGLRIFLLIILVKKYNVDLKSYFMAQTKPA